MLKKDITYQNFDGVEVTETHYFHIYEAEFVEFIILHGIDDDPQTGLNKLLADLIEKNDRAGILALFKELIIMGYGQRNPERPEKFLKTPEIQAEFKSEPAFKALYLELMTSENAATEFLLGAIPRSMSSNPAVAEALTSANSGKKSSTTEVNLPDDTKAWPADNGPQPSDTASYLTQPRDADGNLVPWAFREPTPQELTAMSKPQMMDIFRRKNTDWKPFAFKS